MFLLLRCSGLLIEDTPCSRGETQCTLSLCLWQSCSLISPAVCCTMPDPAPSSSLSGPQQWPIPHASEEGNHFFPSAVGQGGVLPDPCGDQPRPCAIRVDYPDPPCRAKVINGHRVEWSFNSSLSVSDLRTSVYLICLSVAMCTHFSYSIYPTLSVSPSISSPPPLSLGFPEADYLPLAREFPFIGSVL